MGSSCAVASDVGPEPVVLNIYDVGGSAAVQTVNSVLRPFGAGAFHTGVEIYGIEWSFGAAGLGQSGVYSCLPRQCPKHAFRESLRMGQAMLSPLMVEEILGNLSDLWPGSKYDVFTHNCTHFCDHLCKRLSVGGLPAWIFNIESVGSAVDHVLTGIEGIERAVVGSPTDESDMRGAAASLFGSVSSKSFAEPAPLHPGRGAT
eukprot:TRINITY_DN13495_c0_g2_i1.p1 TRINITY_DN13495_c0_g2~~TRINITY_DN13495_c0_g2_i1.p1  ORF type:complete len:217 (+),score=38.15 TRINITY_DN13495_c0_g2_i1:43-651(+)